jgi:8-oxo-dGTP diphosphatase
MGFCPNCGASLEIVESEGRLRPYCPRCARIHYEQLKVGAGALVQHKGRLLLVQRTQQPFRHRWNLPAGYAEADEDPAETVVREVREETGLEIELANLMGVYFFDDDPRGNGILIVYECHAVGGKLTESPEGTNLTFFASDQIPPALAGGGHNQAIIAWQERAEAGRDAA